MRESENADLLIVRTRDSACTSAVCEPDAARIAECFSQKDNLLELAGTAAAPLAHLALQNHPAIAVSGTEVCLQHLRVGGDFQEKY